MLPRVALGAVCGSLVIREEHILGTILLGCM